MKVALFSDLHGNISGLKAVLSCIDHRGGADIVFAAGDIVGGGPGTEDLLDILIDKEVRMIRGNSEELNVSIEAVMHRIPEKWMRLALRTNEWLHGRMSKPYWDLLASLPLYETVELSPDRKVLVCHATPRSPWDRVCSAHVPSPSLWDAYGHVDADVVAHGHLHSHHVLWLGSKLLLNVASIGLRRDGMSAFTLLECVDERWIVQQHLVPYDVEEEARLMVERGVPRP